jgi:hypothetical protein
VYVKRKSISQKKLCAKSLEFSSWVTLLCSDIEVIVKRVETLGDSYGGRKQFFAQV